MEKAVYINSVSAYLPNSPIVNEDMEDYIGKIGGNPSRVRSIVLRQNGIKTRYYGLDKTQSLTHSNAELAKEAVCGLFENRQIPNDLTLLACGTSTPDQLLPSHASMVHGELANYPMEIFSSAGVCLTSLQALKICYSNILAGLHQKAVCVASELTSLHWYPNFMTLSMKQHTTILTKTLIWLLKKILCGLCYLFTFG
jgi:putative 3-oxoacyl-(acyl carrier protein) synthase III